MNKPTISNNAIIGEKSINFVKKDIYKLLFKLNIILNLEELNYMSSKYWLLLLGCTLGEKDLESLEYCLKRDMALEEIRTFDKLVLKQVWRSLKYINYESISNDKMKMAYFVNICILIEKLADLSKNRMRLYKLQNECYGKSGYYNIYLPTYEKESDEQRDIIEAILILNRSTK